MRLAALFGQHVQVGPRLIPLGGRGAAQQAVGRHGLAREFSGAGDARGIRRRANLLGRSAQGLVRLGRTRRLGGHQGLAVGLLHLILAFLRLLGRHGSRLHIALRSPCKGTPEGLRLPLLHIGGHGPLQHLAEGHTAAAQVRLEQVGQVVLLGGIALQRRRLALQHVPAAHGPRRTREGDESVQLGVQFHALGIRHLLDHGLQVIHHVGRRKAVYSVITTFFVRVERLHEVLVAVICIQTLLQHQAVQLLAEEGVHRAVLQHGFPSQNRLILVARSLQRTRFPRLPVRFGHSIVLAEYVLHQHVGGGCLAAQNGVLQIAVRAAEPSLPHTALRPHAVGAVRGLAHAIGRDAVRHGREAAQVRHGAADATVQLRGLCLALKAERHQEFTGLHIVTELGGVCINSSIVGNEIAIPRQVQVLAAPLEGRVIPILPYVTDHKAQLPRLQVAEARLQRPLGLLFHEEIVAPHGIVECRIQLADVGILHGLAAAPAGSECHRQRLVAYHPVVVLPDIMQHLHPPRCVVGHQAAAQVDLLPSLVHQKLLQKGLVARVLIGKGFQHLGRAHTQHLQHLAHAPVFRRFQVADALQLIQRCLIGGTIVTGLHGRLHKIR